MTPTSTENIALAQAKASTGTNRAIPRWVFPSVALVVFAVLAPMGYLSGLGLVTTLTAILFYVVVACAWVAIWGERDEGRRRREGRIARRKKRRPLFCLGRCEQHASRSGVRVGREETLIVRFVIYA